MDETTTTSSSSDSHETPVRVCVRWLGSNVVAVGHDLLLVIKNHDSVLSKSTALQNLIATTMHTTFENHKVVRVVWENGNVELTPNPATGAYCIGKYTVSVAPWALPPATKRAWELICAATHSANNEKQQHEQLKRIVVMISRYSNQDVLTGDFYCCPKRFFHGAVPNEVGRPVTVPKEIGRLVNITRLQLVCNDLHGSIPTEFGKLINMFYLDLGINMLTGSIPTEFGKLINIGHLMLNSNNLTGPIPTELGKLTNIVNLQLRSNKLTGPIPTEFGKLVDIKFLNLSLNQLTGLEKFKLYMNQKVPNARLTCDLS